jgi:eukaryotic-like serine/threonine-protein kinase
VNLSVSSSTEESSESGRSAVVSARVSDLEPGTLINGIYRLVRLLNVGGMGEVWEARHERTKGRVAVKVLLPEMGRHADVLLRFQREVEITSALNHPNIVRVSDADKLPDGRPFLVMEFLDGKDLTQLTGQPLPLADVVEIVEQVALGLHAAHGQSVIHRDLKPANIFVTPLAGTSRFLIKILDFGISKAHDGLSKLTRTHSVIGTPYYMAPEQARGGATSMDARADQFSLAAIAYELVTGQMPFDGDGTLNVLYKVVAEPPPTFASLGRKAPASVEEIVMRGLSKSPDERFGSVLEFSAALRAACGIATDGRPVLTSSSGTSDRSVPARLDSAPDLATPRTRRLPDGPGTTLRESTGQIETRADSDQDGAGNRGGAASTTTSKAVMLGVAIGGLALGGVTLAVAFRGSAPAPAVPSASPRRAEPEIGVPSEWPLGPKPIAAGTAAPPPAPAPASRQVPSKTPTLSPEPAPSTASDPAPAPGTTATGTFAVVRARASSGAGAKKLATASVRGGAARKDQAAATRASGALEVDPAPSGKRPTTAITRQPGPINDDL